MSDQVQAHMRYCPGEAFGGCPNCKPDNFYACPCCGDYHLAPAPGMRPWRECTICKIPIGSSTCSHVDRYDGRVIMSEEAHESLVAELARLSTLENADG